MSSDWYVMTCFGFCKLIIYEKFFVTVTHIAIVYCINYREKLLAYCTSSQTIIWTSKRKEVNCLLYYFIFNIVCKLQMISTMVICGKAWITTIIYAFARTSFCWTFIFTVAMTGTSTSTTFISRACTLTAAVNCQSTITITRPLPWSRLIMIGRGRNLPWSVFPMLMYGDGLDGGWYKLGPGCWPGNSWRSI